MFRGIKESGTAVLDTPPYSERPYGDRSEGDIATLDRPSVLERRARNSRIHQRIDPRNYTQPSGE